MTDKVFEEIMAVRSSGAVNMLSVVEVQRYAHDHEMYDLVVYVEENKKEYCQFIMDGKRPENPEGESAANDDEPSDGSVWRPITITEKATGRSVNISIFDREMYSAGLFSFADLWEMYNDNPVD